MSTKMSRLEQVESEIQSIWQVLNLFVFEPYLEEHDPEALKVLDAEERKEVKKR